MCSGNKNGQNLWIPQKIEDTRLSLFAWTEHYLSFAKTLYLTAWQKVIIIQALWL